MSKEDEVAGIFEEARRLMKEKMEVLGQVCAEFNGSNKRDLLAKLSALKGHITHMTISKNRGEELEDIDIETIWKLVVGITSRFNDLQVVEQEVKKNQRKSEMQFEISPKLKGIRIE